MQKLSYRKTAIALLLIAIVVVASVAVYLFESSKARTGNVNPKFTPTPVPLYDYNCSVLNPQVTEVSGYNGFYNNVSQGLPLEVNITFMSLTNQPIRIPIENLTVTYFSSIVDLHRWIDSNGNYSAIQQQAFNYSFSQNQVTLQPDMSNSILLTINLAQNAPIGQYSIDISLGKATQLNANENSQFLTYYSGIGLEMIVTPRAS